MKKIPKPKRAARVFLYLATVAADGLAMACISADFLPEWLRIVVYCIAACTLALTCCYLPGDVAGFSRAVRKKERELLEKHPGLFPLLDYQSRTFGMAVPSSVVNLAFAGFNAVVGILDRSAWSVSLAAYYLCLCVMRFGLLYYAFAGRKKVPQGQRTAYEWQLCAKCGGVLLLMSIALSGMVILMVRRGYGKNYRGYLIFIVALYTFAKVISAILSVVKVRKLRVPILIGVKNIGFADALVSLLNLQTAMFASFGGGDEILPITMNTITGGCVCVLVIALGIFMVGQGIHYAKGGAGTERRSGRNG